MNIKTGTFEKFGGNDYFIADSPLLWIDEYKQSPVIDLLISKIDDRFKGLLKNIKETSTYRESVDSCAIENIDCNSEYRSYYDFALGTLKSRPCFSSDELLDIHTLIMNIPSKKDILSGKYRSLNVKIGDFYPAPYWDVVKLMNDFFDFINKEDLNINFYVKTAIAHAYFESIHPFHDGNGRIGRINILWMLINNIFHDKQIKIHPSVYFLKNRQEYYQRLLDYSYKGSINEWIEFFLRSFLE